MLVATVVPLLALGRGDDIPPFLGIGLGLLLTGFGVSSIASALAPYAVSRPGDSPFQQPQRSGSGAGSQGLVLLGALLVTVPAFWWGWLAITRDPSFAMPALWAGLAAGVIVFVAGVAIGSAVFERRGSRLMEFAESA